MKVAYHAANVIDAQLVVDLLATAGIPAHVQGSYLSGGIGELPAGELVRVWVATNQLADARQLLAEQWHGIGVEPATDDGVFERSWAAAWAAIEARGDGDGLRDRLLAAWSEPQRRYHTLQHLEECLWLFEAHAGLADEPGDVAMALWFHDAVYEVRATDNEVRSAQWAAAALAEAGVAAERCERVHALVMATRHDVAPASRDQALLVDIDLSILGAAPERFDEYEVQVRQEYAWVPRPLFRRKRREILQGFLDRPAIYSTPVLHDELEARGRDNLQRAVARLRPWYRFLSSVR